MGKIELLINKDWLCLLKAEFEKLYFLKLQDFLAEEKMSYNFFPIEAKIFSAFNFTPIEKLKVVIIGQDPYHGRNQANGLSFSVSDTVKIPASLKNIFKEIKNDLDIELPTHGNLESWANQGVLLLNATLTVRENNPSSHQKQGWEIFTDEVIRKISESKNGIVFLLWGNFAKKKAQLIDRSKHFILEAPHPSPLARGGFFGCKHFSKTNEILASQGKIAIDWKLT